MKTFVECYIGNYRIDNLFTWIPACSHSFRLPVPLPISTDKVLNNADDAVRSNQLVMVFEPSDQKYVYTGDGEVVRVVQMRLKEITGV